MTRRSIQLNNVSRLLLYLVFILPLLIKYTLASLSIAKQSGEGWGSILPIILHDSGVYFVILLFLLISNARITKSPIAFVLRLLALLIFIIYTADIVTARVFAMRLNVEDVIKFFSSAPHYITVTLLQLFSLKQLMIAALLLICLFFAVRRWRTLLDIWYARISTMKIYAWLNVSLLLITGSCFFLKAERSYVHDWYFQNIFEYLYRVSGHLTPYSEDKKQQLMARYEQGEITGPTSCSQGSGQHKDIILLLFESLSMKHSQFFSGLSNTTPHLDKIAENNTSFSHFYANGFTTEDGLIAILTGRPPLPSPDLFVPGGSSSFDGFFDVETSLPKILNQVGYRTEFVTSGNLDFIDKRQWLKQIGFDYLEGHKHPEYAGLRNHIFDSAPDKKLYQRALARLFEESTTEQPLFLTIETVSTHSPFQNPETAERTETAAFEYADSALGEFYQTLLDRHFFQQGLLIIVSDHRSMTPIESAELDRYGYDRAPARIPMIIVDGKHEPRTINEVFQQTDILPSIGGLTGGSYCFGQWQGNFFSSPLESPRYIVHRRGDRRDRISVFSSARNFQIRLNGDKTGFADDGLMPDSGEHDRILDFINYHRIR